MSSKIWIALVLACTVVTAGIGFHFGQRKGHARGEIEGIHKGTTAERERTRLAAEQQAAVARAVEDTKRAETDRLQRLEIERAEAARAQAEQERARLAAIEAQRAADAAARRAAEGPSPYGTVRVLAVGINYTGHPSLTPLAFAERDAASTADLLEKSYRFEVTRLLGADATGPRIASTLESLLASLGPDDDFLFYFSGHGSTLVENQTQRVGLILPFDAASASADKTTQRARALEIARLVGQLKNAPGRHRIAVLDSCFSGLPALVGISVQATPIAGSEAGNPLRHRSVQLISAGGANERALELPSIAGGIFSHELRRALTAEDAGAQSLLRLFLTVKESVTRKSDYVQAADGRPASPQHRSFETTPGDFVFIPPPAYSGWARSHDIGTGVEAFVLRPVSEDELRTFLAQLSPPKTESPAGIGALTQHVALPSAVASGSPPDPPAAVPSVAAADLRRYETRASLGDPRALAILSALAGRSPDPARRQAGAEYAFTAFETGAASGKAALGLAYTEGFGVSRDAKLGLQLLQVSGYADLLPWLQDFAALVGGREMLRQKDPATVVHGALVVAGGLKNLWGKVTNVFRKNPVETLTTSLQSVRKELATNPPNIVAARQELGRAHETVKSAKDLNDEGRTALLDVVTAIQQSCENADPAEALKLIDVWLNGIAQQRK